MKLKVVLVAALAPNRVIGLNGDMPWPKLPKDMGQFKRFTINHPVVMGRTTRDSIPPEYWPFDERTNIVLSRDANYQTEGAHTCNSIEAAIDAARQFPGGDTVMVIGGGEIYQLALPYATNLRLTHIQQEFDGDTYFPQYEHLFRKVAEEDPITQKDITFTVADYVRR